MSRRRMVRLPGAKFDTKDDSGYLVKLPTRTAGRFATPGTTFMARPVLFFLNDETSR